MIESIEPRHGTQPSTNSPLVAPGSFGNPINGSERAIPNNDDLQYACIFDLPKPITCSGENCECSNTAAGTPPENPLCWSDTTGKYTNVQRRAKAYPSRRLLATLKGVGSQAIVASVCPESLANAGASNYGYRPAITAIVDRVKSAFSDACLGESLDMSENGVVSCAVIEATKQDQCSPCTGVRSPLTGHDRELLQRAISGIGVPLNCGCEIKQVSPGAAMKECTESVGTQSLEGGGWCYVAPQQNPSHNASLVDSCPPNSQQTIRFVGKGMPVAGSVTFLACDGWCNAMVFHGRGGT